ncbi:GTPase and tRNA-U34 5-formylation enzyme TrmE [hydrothermal vent metagenome]|uniref:GTPase and tRNA-U34 5-formylation enzyme TrmE n=1 Tax=hydrothermal vent metagenome TaxID=652676 RepID=A0A3B1E776_9ZZZZ
MNLKNTNDTIVAIATASGIGSISIVRLSGSNSLKIAYEISRTSNLTPRVATLSKLYDYKNELIDEAILIYFKNPFSFTGEDVVEFQCHGGFVVSSMILNTCINMGARIANPGEFSKRAFLNKKIDLSQASAISNLIEAKSENAAKLMARQLKGELSDFVDTIRKDLIFILALSEVNIDYAEEDLPADIFDTINQKLMAIQLLLTNTLKISQQREGLIDGFKIAIVGKPNVGKSSLLNKLLNFNRAIVSEIAGTTRDTIEENIKIGTHIIKIIDTAGIHDTNNEIEKIGIKRSRESINDADMIIALFDGSRKFDYEDQEILDLVQTNDKIRIMAITKIDLEQKLVLKLPSEPLRLNTKDNIDCLLEQIELILNKNNLTHDVTLVSKQQVTQVNKTLTGIISSFTPLKNGELELFSYHINESLEYISNITRPYEHNQMLDVMFGEFCLGK